MKPSTREFVSLPWRTVRLVLFMLVAHVTWAQAGQDHHTQAIKRLNGLSHQWESCDKLKAEGDRLNCSGGMLAAYEQEIQRLTAEVRSSLPQDQWKTLDSSASTWLRYFTAEKRHLKNLSNAIGTVRWVGLHDNLVAIAKARCEFLCQQLKD